MNNRYLHDADFKYLVDWLLKLIVDDKLFTLSDLHDALGVVDQHVEFYKTIGHSEETKDEREARVNGPNHWERLGGKK